ncbi:hypothetical protein Sjap_012571 [Stephania japonica]|uniref:Rapid ALkalinization Factor n=1 Tax=Stephania japonica TaxID=461633 RepID=A0AAP0IWC1_9MAGN
MASRKLMMMTIYLHVILMLTSLIVETAGDKYINYDPLGKGPKGCLLPHCPHIHIPEQPYERGCEKTNLCRSSPSPGNEDINGDDKVGGVHENHKHRKHHKHGHNHHRKKLRHHVKYEMPDQDPEWLQTNNIVVLGH